MVDPNLFNDVPIFDCWLSPGSELDYGVNLKAESEIEELLQRAGKIEDILVENTNEDD